LSPPSSRFAHQPVRRGLASSLSAEPDKSNVGIGAEGGGCGAGIGVTAVVSSPKFGAGSRTVERRRGAAGAGAAVGADCGSGKMTGSDATDSPLAGSVCSTPGASTTSGT
jgi:hypothetical protein